MENKDFYPWLVGMAPAGANYDAQCAGLAEKNLDKALEAAHAIKGVPVNLALTPLLNPVSEMKETPRVRIDMDYGPPLSNIKAQRETFLALCQQSNGLCLERNKNGL